MAVCCVVCVNAGITRVPTTLTYSLGVGGNGTWGDNSGATAPGGTQTSVSYKGATLVANGGPGSSGGNASLAAATYSGGDGGALGGKGYGYFFGAAKGGPAIGAVDYTGAVGPENGRQSADVSGLQAAVVGAGLAWTGAGSYRGQNATGFGCGGGGVSLVAQRGGNGYLGGGGGNGDGAYYGGNGGNGAVVLQKTSSISGVSYVVLTSGTSYVITADITNVKIWAIGAGGGGTSNYYGSSWGGCGGAGAVCYKSFAL